MRSRYAFKANYQLYLQMTNQFFQSPDGILMPKDSDLVWRYMSFERFENLLTTSSLYFTRLDQFSDFREASMSEPSQSAVRQELGAQGDDGSIASVVIALQRATTASSCYANCWAMGLMESNLHWRAYGGGGSFKIAIMSTVGQLIGSVKAPSSDSHAGKVRYIDYNSDRSPNDIIKKAFVKRREYKSECEFRILECKRENLPSGIIANAPETEKGHLVQVDLKRLIAKIFIEPVSISDQEKLGISGRFTIDVNYQKHISDEMDRRKNLVSSLATKHISEGFTSIEFSGIL
jgi:hypothetical protein